jgi:hypothetical protein
MKKTKKTITADELIQEEILPENVGEVIGYRLSARKVEYLGDSLIRHVKPN